MLLKLALYTTLAIVSLVRATRLHTDHADGSPKQSSGQRTAHRWAALRRFAIFAAKLCAGIVLGAAGSWFFHGRENILWGIMAGLMVAVFNGMMVRMYRITNDPDWIPPGETPWPVSRFTVRAITAGGLCGAFGWLIPISWDREVAIAPIAFAGLGVMIGAVMGAVYESLQRRGGTTIPAAPNQPPESGSADGEGRPRKRPRQGSETGPGKGRRKRRTQQNKQQTTRSARPNTGAKNRVRKTSTATLNSTQSSRAAQSSRSTPSSPSEPPPSQHRSRGQQPAPRRRRSAEQTQTRQGACS